MQFHILYTVHFSLSPQFYRLQNSCITLAIIQHFAAISYPSQKVRSSSVITDKQKKKYSPSVTQIYKFAVTPTCYNAKQPHLSPIKTSFTYKFFQWAQRCTQLKHIIPTKPEQQRAPTVLCRVLYHLSECGTPPHSLATTFTSFHTL
jgi:ssDNA-binding Zn-finger/Zn-ribbon topoisomerase 1